MNPKPEKPLAALPPFTAIPNDLIDQVMPTLKDTQWRLLCVICRQTVGWQHKSGCGRKVRDWMSQKQLMARTGRNSAALSHALDVLVQKDLVECSDSQGRLLLTPQQRRNHRGRLYFALAARFWVQPDEDTTSTPLESTQDARTLAEGRQDEKANLTLPEMQTVRIYRGWARADSIVKRQEPRHSHG